MGRLPSPENQIEAANSAWFVTRCLPSSCISVVTQHSHDGANRFGGMIQHGAFFFV